MSTLRYGSQISFEGGAERAFFQFAKSCAFRGRGLSSLKVTNINLGQTTNQQASAIVAIVCWAWILHAKP